MIINPSRLAAALPAYELGAELGTGGFGTVIAGRHRSLGREVAVKVLASSNVNARTSFAAEARILASVDHPHIVRLYDYVENNEILVIIMELLAGGTLTRRQAWLTAEDSCAVGLAVAEALACAHGRGVLHRDVKPDNILFDAGGVVKVTDFGLAKMFTGAAVNATMVVGTPTYMAPEQITNARLSPSTDVYSLGVVLYELLARRSPFDPNVPYHALYYQIVNNAPAPLPDVPPPLRDAVMRALTKDPRHRHPSAHAFALDLADAAVRSFGTGWLARSKIKLKLSDEVQAAASRPSAPWPQAPPPTRQPHPTSGQMMPGQAAAAPIAPSPIAPSPIAPSPMTTGPMAIGQVAAGPKAAGPMTAGPMAAGPMAAGPMAAGPMGTGPMATGPIATGQVAARHSTVQHPAARQPAVQHPAARHPAMQHPTVMQQQHDPRRHDRRRRLTAVGIAVPLAIAAIGAAFFALTGGTRDASADANTNPPTAATAPASSPGPLVVSPTLLSTLPGLDSAVLSVAFSPDGTVLATGGADASVRLWDVRDANRPSQLADLSPRSGDFRDQDDQDDQDDGNGYHHDEAVKTVTFSPDGKTLATGGEDDQILLWDVSVPSQPEWLVTLDDHTADVETLAFSPDGRTLASGGDDYDVLLWNVSNVHRPQLWASVDWRWEGRHTGAVESLAFSPDGDTLATGGADARVLLWDVSAMGQPTLSNDLEDPTHTVESLAFSPDGKTLASGGIDDLLLWDLTAPAKPALAATLHDQGGPVRSLAFAADGRALATGGDDGVLVWDVTDPRQAHVVAPVDERHDARAPVAFPQSGDVLATGGSDQTLRLWRLR